MGGQVEKEYCRPFPYPTPPTALQGGREEEVSRGGGTAWAAGTAFRPPACRGKAATRTTSAARWYATLVVRERRDNMSPTRAAPSLAML